MFRKPIRAVALLMAAACLSLAAAGCSKDPVSSGSASGGGSTQSGSQDEKVDLNQMEIVFTAMSPGFFTPEEGTDAYEELEDFKAEVEEHFNCKIRLDYYSPWDVYFQKIQDMTMAGEQIGDFVAFDGYIYPSTLLNGVFTPIEDYVNVKDYSLWDKDCETFFDIKGHIYAVSSRSERMVPPYFCLYNKTLFEEKGLSAKYDLKSLVMNKEWTWDKFREVLRDSTFDTNGDGKTDIWGLSGQGYQFATITEALAYANNAPATRKEGDGVKIVMNEAPYLDTLEFMHTVTWEDKVISTEEKWRAYDSFNLFAQGGSMFWIGTNWWVQTLKTMVDDTVFSVLPVPIGPNAGGEYTVYVPATNHTFGMPSTCKNRKEAGMVFEYWMKNCPKDDRGVRASWTDKVFDTESLDVIEMLSKLPYTFDWSSPNTTTYTTVKLGEHGIPDRTPPATFVASVLDSLQAEVDQLWSLADLS